MDEFYTAGGKASHVLHVLDTSETKKKANEVKGLFSKENSPSLVFQVAAVFHSVEVLVLRAAQGGGSAPTMQVWLEFVVLFSQRSTNKQTMRRSLDFVDKSKPFPSRKQRSTW